MWIFKDEKGFLLSTTNVSIQDDGQCYCNKHTMQDPENFSPGLLIVQVSQKEVDLIIANIKILYGWNLIAQKLIPVDWE